jgi:hypothetical protein
MTKLAGVPAASRTSAAGEPENKEKAKLATNEGNCNCWPFIQNRIQSLI